MERVEIYALFDPRDCIPRYIGKANDTRKRLLGHIRDSRRRDTPVYRWIRSLLEEQVMPQAVVVAVTLGSEWEETEKQLIAQWKEAGYLLNVAVGGNMPRCPTEVRQANARLATKLRTSTPEKARIFELKRRLGQFLKKGWLSEASRARLRYAAAKRPDLFACFANC
jgi:hypothetical protein